MNKFTIFTVILSVVIIVTIAEMLVSNYFGGVVDSRSLATNVLGTDFTPSDSTDALSVLPQAQTKDALGADATFHLLSGNVGPFALSQVEPPKDFDRTKAVTQQDLDAAGFLGLQLKIVPFEGKIFQLIDLSDLKPDHFVQYNVADDKNVYGVIIGGWFYNDVPAAEQLYELLKSRAAKIPGIEVNETKQYGNANFYVNDSKRVGTAFSVVRIENRVYALSYPKASHDFYKQLLGILATRTK